MNWRSIVRPAVSIAIGQCGFSRATVIRLVSLLHGDLPARADRLRRRRNPADPDSFSYRVVLLDGGRRHTCVFQVDDVTAPGFLFVGAMKYSTG